MSGVSNARLADLKDRLDATHARVVRLEAWADRFSGAGFWLRLRWLILGH